jgi:hypothetical protein
VAAAVATKSLGVETIAAAPSHKGDAIPDELSEGLWISRNNHRIEGWRHEEAL